MSGCPDPRAGGWSCLLHLNARMRLKSGSEEAWRMASSIQGNLPFLVLYRLLGHQILAFFYTKQHEAFSTFSRAGSEAAPLHSAISATQDKSIFMEHYPESLFFTQITQANERVDWEWGRRQELDPGAGRTLRWGELQGSFWHIPGYFWAFPFPQQNPSACEGAGRMVGLDPGAGCPCSGCPCRIPAPSSWSPQKSGTASPCGNPSLGMGHC